LVSGLLGVVRLTRGHQEVNFQRLWRPRKCFGNADGLSEYFSRLYPLFKL
jgi:hypothetical protein